MPLEGFSTLFKLTSTDYCALTALVPTAATQGLVAEPAVVSSGFIWTV